MPLCLKIIGKLKVTQESDWLKTSQKQIVTNKKKRNA
jgi:hypothetical protein